MFPPVECSFGKNNIFHNNSPISKADEKIKFDLYTYRLLHINISLQRALFKNSYTSCMCVSIRTFLINIHNEKYRNNLINVSETESGGRFYSLRLIFFNCRSEWSTLLNRTIDVHVRPVNTEQPNKNFIRWHNVCGISSSYVSISNFKGCSCSIPNRSAVPDNLYQQFYANRF